ncbi:hypothetical protein ACP70R_030850 [Stipagrostis hirtigluma subsp. patula]
MDEKRLWTRKETDKLVLLRNDMDAVFRAATCETDIRANWVQVSQRMGAEGCYHAPRDCRRKFRRLVHYFHSKQGGGPYRDELAALAPLPEEVGGGGGDVEGGDDGAHDNGNVDSSNARSGYVVDGSNIDGGNARSGDVDGGKQARSSRIDGGNATSSKTGSGFAMSPEDAAHTLVHMKTYGNRRPTQ